MDIAFTIPVWILWLLGVPLGIAILFLAVIGLIMLISFRHWTLF